MKRSVSIGGIVINDRGEIAMVSNKGISWGFPKGHPETGEEPLATAEREIREETGLKGLQLVKCIGTYERHPQLSLGKEDTSILKSITMYLFRTSATSIKPLDPENPEARFVPKEKVVGLLTHQKDKEFFTKVYQDVE